MAWTGWDSFADSDAQYGCSLHAICPRTSSVLVATRCTAFRARREKPKVDAAIRRVRRSNRSLRIVGIGGVPDPGLHLGKHHRVSQSREKPPRDVHLLRVCNVCRSVVLHDEGRRDLLGCKPGHSPGRIRGERVCLHFGLLCLRSRSKSDHSCVLLEKQRRPAVPLHATFVWIKEALKE